jgi:hypothetical protein
MSKQFFRRKVLGITTRGITQDPQTGQSVQFAKHSGDIIYDLVGDDAIAKQSEYRTLSRELILNPVLKENLNEVGENKHIIERTQKSRQVRLDK